MKQRIFAALLLSVGAYAFTWGFLAILSLIMQRGSLPNVFNPPLVLMCIAGGILGFIEGK